MAFAGASKFRIFALVLLCSSVTCFFYSGKAYDEEVGAGGISGRAFSGGGAGEGDLGGGGGSFGGGGAFGGGGSGSGGALGGGGVGAAGFGDPPEIFAKALFCLNDKRAYSGCVETWRLTASGYLNIPAAYAGEFCRGPCLKETHLVLNCMENVVHNFRFYNRATIRDIRNTMAAGCGYGRDRGNFNVLEHIEEEEESKGGRDKSPILIATLLLTVVSIFLV